jgi:RimJ/RimL family protein N-acetyltransferase
VAETAIVEASDADFEAMIDGRARLPNGLVPAPGGVEDRVVLERLRRLSERLRDTNVGGIRMMIADGEVVGTCGVKGEPSPGGDVEIGYGVSASRRRRGHATRAVAALVAAIRRDPAIRTVTAETLVDNVASQGVLKRCGFRYAGTRFDPNDGELIVWRYTFGRDGAARRDGAAGHDDAARPART